MTSKSIIDIIVAQADESIQQVARLQLENLNRVGLEPFDVRALDNGGLELQWRHAGRKVVSTLTREQGEAVLTVRGSVLQTIRTAGSVLQTSRTAGDSFAKAASTFLIDAKLIHNGQAYAVPVWMVLHSYADDVFVSHADDHDGVGVFLGGHNILDVSVVNDDVRIRTASMSNVAYVKADDIDDIKHWIGFSKSSLAFVKHEGEKRHQHDAQLRVEARRKTDHDSQKVK